MAKPKAKDDSEKPKTSKNISDVAPAGQSAPSPTSKSVIVTSRPLMRDPMMAASQAPADLVPAKEGNSESATVRHERVILPHASAPILPASSDEPEKDTVTLLKPAAKSADSVTQAEKTDEAKPGPESNPASTEIAPIEGFTVSESIPASTPDTPADPEDLPEPDAEAAELERQKALEQLVTSQKYFLPVNAVGQKRAKQFTVFGFLLIVLLLAAWVNIALDANLIQINGVQALTNFFAN